MSLLLPAQARNVSSWCWWAEDNKSGKKSHEEVAETGLAPGRGRGVIGVFGGLSLNQMSKDVCCVLLKPCLFANKKPRAHTRAVSLLNHMNPGSPTLRGSLSLPLHESLEEP